jgi:hypothetical protein
MGPGSSHCFLGPSPGKGRKARSAEQETGTTTVPVSTYGGYLAQRSFNIVIDLTVTL